MYLPVLMNIIENIMQILISMVNEINDRHKSKLYDRRKWDKTTLRLCCATCMSRLMGKPTICLCENKGADQLRGNREADQRLCFRYSDSTIPLLLKFEISIF